MRPANVRPALDENGRTDGFNVYEILREALLGGMMIQVCCPPGAPVQIADLEHLEAMLRARMGGAAILDRLGRPLRALTWLHQADGQLVGEDTESQALDELRSGFRQAFTAS